MKPVLVLGVGNTLRSDDGAGVRAAEQIGVRRPHIDVETAHQLMPDHAERFRHYRRVMIMDASVRAQEATISRLEAGEQSSSIHSHESSPADLLMLCQSLYGEAPEEIVLVEIPVSTFAFGETLSPLTAQGVARAVELADSYLSGLDL
jgi:hydrogenase maturation protease